ncbi:MAG: hypothetical protein HQ483_10650 [Rhodospirillales bacterium]|nr:hypothetical protein [Rhodospirillales bacterium]
MFLRMLNDDQKRSLLVIAFQLVQTDHSISEKEDALLDEVINGLRTDIPVTPQQLYERPSLTIFDTRPVRVAVMLEILTLAVGDNRFPAAESKMVSALAKELGFSADDLAWMTSWAGRSAALLDEAQQRMADSA